MTTAMRNKLASHTNEFTQIGVKQQHYYLHSDYKTVTITHLLDCMLHVGC